MTFKSSHIIPFAAIAISLLTACSGSGSSDEPLPGSAAIRFSAIENPSRATTMLQTLHSTFDVWAWKTMSDNSEQAVMNKAGNAPYQVAYASPRWVYDGYAGQTERFWDFSASFYIFSAVSPHPSTGNSASVDASHHVRITGINANSSESTDWLIAHFKRQNSTSSVSDFDLLEPTATATSRSTLAEDVQLPFHHILSLADWRIYTNGATTEKLLSVTVTTADGNTIFTTADYNEGQTGASAWNDTYKNWSNHSNTQTTILSTNLNPGLSLMGAISPTTAKPIARIHEIPQAFTTEGLPITITITTDERTVSNSFTLNGSWDTNMRYIYLLTFDVENEIILLNIDVSQYHWQEGDPIDAGKVENW